MAKIHKTPVAEGITYVSVPDADLRILCGCPADSVKHLMKRGLIHSVEENGITFETGPNAILLSDILIQNGQFANLSEFPVLQMFYRQGMLIPGHPNNKGVKPVLLGSRKQVKAQLEYIYRGNYGLISPKEMTDAGVSAQEAQILMRLKLKFAFGYLARPDELLDQLVVESEPQEIRNSVFIRRLELNHFEISYRNNTVRVDLSLPPHVSYQPSYPLGFHLIPRDYFSVLHSGEGDGWDINRPAMASILIFQGKVFLIDAGPNIMHSLKALGIGVNEVAGIFQTHAHDDHFCGLTALMRADHRINYFATSLVRASVIKKLSALTMSPEEEFDRYFDFHDLRQDRWNEIEGLDVKPVFSPHPVETTVLWFRTLDKDGYKTYAHFADMVGLKVLRGMVDEDAAVPGLTRRVYDQVASSYLEPADLKKLDIGGGMIHGEAEDFALDRSTKIVLAHTALPLTNKQKEIGSGAPFGMVDVLIAPHQEYVRSFAYHFLGAYFPTVPPWRLKVLLNNPMVVFNPESIILKAGDKAECVHLLLTGEVEMLNTARGVVSVLSSGGLIGEHTALSGQESQETYRAASFVQALRIPLELYLRFVRLNGLLEEMTDLQASRDFLYTTRLFGDSISCTVQNTIAKSMLLTPIRAGEKFVPAMEPRLYIIREGYLDLMLDDEALQRLGPGDSFGESTVLHAIPCLFTGNALTDLVLGQIPGPALSGIPIVRLELRELHDRRLDMALSLENTGGFIWRQAFATRVEAMDQAHQGLFQAARKLSDAVQAGQVRQAIDPILDFLLGYTQTHFKEEEKLMRDHGYPLYLEHKQIHERLMADVLGYAECFKRGDLSVTSDFVVFLKEWVIMHTLTEDRKYMPFFSDLGIS